MGFKEQFNFYHNAHVLIKVYKVKKAKHWYFGLATNPFTSLNSARSRGLGEVLVKTVIIAGCLRAKITWPQEL